MLPLGCDLANHRLSARLALPPMPPALPPRLIVLSVCSALLLAGCYQVPVTGRRALDAVDDKALKEQSVAKFNEMKKRTPISRNRDYHDRVQRVGSRIAKVVFWDLPDADWEFVVFDGPQINAFAMPGGKVGVFAGLFRVAQNDDQLASVLAHEIAHITARHTHERLSQAMLVQGGGLALGGLVAAQTGNIYTAGSAVQTASAIGGIGLILPFDRAKEKEADHIGLIYMARAGYNPEEAIKVFEHLEAENAGKPQPGGWISTHPSYPDRILQMMDLMPKALAAYRQSGAKPVPVLVK